MTITNETKIGVLTAIAITILILGYSFLRGEDVFSGSNKFYAVYKSVDGLSVSKPVLVNGFQIGRISKMKLLPNGRTLVEFKIDHQYNVPSNTLAKLVSTDLLGSKAIVFEYGNSNTYAQDNDTLRADIQGSLTESLQPIQMKAENLISKLDSTMGSINRILNPGFQKNVDRSFVSIANSLQTLEGTTKKIDALISSQTEHVNGILTNTETVSSNLKISSVHLTGITENFDKMSNDLANSNIKQVIDNANKAMTDLQATIGKINGDKGSLGLLLNDDKLYNNLKTASKNLDTPVYRCQSTSKALCNFLCFWREKEASRLVIREWRLEVRD